MIFAYQAIHCQQIIKWIMTASELENDMQDLVSTWILQVFSSVALHSTVFSLMFKYTNIIYWAIIFW